MTPIPPQPDAAELARLGIIRISTEHFQIGPYRYANLADAIAEAKRDRAPGNDA